MTRRNPRAGGVLGGLALLAVVVGLAGPASAEQTDPAPEVVGSAPWVGTGPTGPAPPPSAAPETVFNPDGRTQVNPTTTYPSSAIGRLVSSFGGQTVACTGVLVGADFVLTAADCVWRDDVADSITFLPRQNGASVPTTCFGAFVYTTEAWKASGTPQQDFAGVQLSETNDCDQIGRVVGYLGYLGNSNRDHFTGDPAIVRGYPTDKPVGTMWTMKDVITRSQRQMFFDRIDTAAGQIGAPLYHWEDPAGSLPAGYYALGVHSYGAGLPFQPCNCNAATRITNPRVGLIQGWMAAN